MQLLTKDLRDELPRLNSQNHIPNEQKIAHAKFFFPIGKWTWYVMEGCEEGDDYIFFGYIIALEEGFRNFRLSDLMRFETIGLSIERDLSFKPDNIENILNKTKG
jgi:hypothetical protein